MTIAFSLDQINSKVQFENPWWGTSAIDDFYQKMRKREYFRLFFPLVEQIEVKRAVVLMGPRRVGKTVMIFHAIQELISRGVDPRRICYFSVETPLFNGIALEELLNIFISIQSIDLARKERLYIFFDEIQYLKNWEVHLKSLVDSYHYINFTVSGSAAAALKLKSNESGAGRFTDFRLPPLTFHEYLCLTGKHDIIIETPQPDAGVVRFSYDTTDIDTLNDYFFDYINFGGYPEVSLSAQIQSNSSRYIRNDIIDKVLLRDLPSLYGIEDVQELNSLFTYIAYNSGNEFSLDCISQNSGVNKNTIKKYLTYLEAAFLIKIVHRIDASAKKFKRATFFKVYLTNPSLRSALFSPIDRRDDFAGNMVETSVFAQWMHDEGSPLYYARWDSGEVDIVYLDSRGRVFWCLEIKWSNRFAENPAELKSLRSFMKKHNVGLPSRITTIDINKKVEYDGTILEFVPASLYCYEVGRNLVTQKE
jgi:predicted AAA+ superfamily ATPase